MNDEASLPGYGNDRAVLRFTCRIGIFRGDDTGRLMTGGVLSAADRGVRVRILIDDGETIDGDEQITVLEAHPYVRSRTDSEDHGQ